MKLIAVYRTVILFVMSSMLPAMLYAVEVENISSPFRLKAIESVPVIFQDSIPIRRGGDKKEQDRPLADTRPGGNRSVDNKPGENRPEKIKRIQEINAENQRVRQKSGIKQVPRSMPKLKPKAVTNRVPIRRPPMRIPKKGIGGIHF
jgi:hypothetical protein